ncbi:MAG: GNAT family N-acetyltransferase [Nitrospira sp.]|nr:GNAT family N-acetyltransferase [Nitrospira sp.]
MKPLNLAVYDGDTIIGVVPLILMKNYKMKWIMVSLPYLCTGGILSDNDTAEHMILNKIKELTVTHSCSSTLLRSEHIGNETDYDYIDKRKSTFTLPLDPDPEKVFKGFQKQIKRRIRKGYKSGCEIDISKKYLKDFYEIYTKNMRLLGSPVHKREFYSEILHRFPDNYNILVVLLDKKVIGAQFLSYFKDTVYLPLASSLKEYNEYSPNHLLYWESIKFGCENGYQVCDFGRSTIDSGPHVFKRQWNADEIPLHYCYLNAQGGMNDNTNDSSKKLDFLSQLWRQTPLKITNILGPCIAKWFP